jgi:hypothetical protein
MRSWCLISQNTWERTAVPFSLRLFFLKLRHCSLLAGQTFIFCAFAFISLVCAMRSFKKVLSACTWALPVLSAVLPQSRDDVVRPEGKLLDLGTDSFLYLLVFCHR